MFHLHRAERTDTLADALAGVLANPLSDPLRPEVVAVPAAGVERWLSQHVSTIIGASDVGGDGIAANIDFIAPHHLADRIVAASAGTGGAASSRGIESPWRPEAVVFTVLRVLDEMLHDPRMRLLARHLGATPDTAEDEFRRSRRYATARHIADLFAGYGYSRPAMLAEWVDESDTDGAGARIPDAMSWQPELWRRVRAVMGAPHPAETLPGMCARIREDRSMIPLSVLPERLSVFGPTRITASMLQLLDALSVHRDVHVFVPHPSPALWSAVAAVSPAEPATPHGGVYPPIRRADRPAPAVRHPLVASLSRDVQELQLRIAPLADTDTHYPPKVDSRTALAAVQAGIRHDDPEIRCGTVSPAPSGVADTSVEVHSCHGAERQVEVLRDRILHLFESDQTLEPRDVLIMCPDVEAFAPLIRGAFGQPGLGHPAFDLRVRLADRGLRHTNSVLDVVASIVDIAAGRAAAGEIVDLLSTTPVRTRFAFSDDDLDMIREWLSRANIRWAIDDTQRARFGLAGFGQQTFEAGLDRISLGVVADEDDGEWLGRALPLAGVDSTHIDLVGRFSECIERLSRVLTACLDERSTSAWADLLIEAIDDLTATDRDDEWQRAQAIRTLAAALDASGDDASGDDASDNNGASSIPLRLGDVRDLIAATVAGRPTRANFRTGELTVCSMVPMRSVPHRVIVLLGIDADTFPRVQRTDGDDVLGVDPLIGERNPRDEDRQMFLDAIGAARDHLIVFHTGADPVSGARVPPAVVVSELIDCVAAVSGREPDDVVIRHTLHGFDERNFLPGAVPGITGPFGFDAPLLDGARALRSDPIVVPRIGDARLPPRDSDDVELADLIAFLANPFDAFLRQRLGARLPDDDRPHADELDVELDSLSTWSIGDRLLRELLNGADIAACQAAELRRGTLPPFAFGRRVLADVSTRATQLHTAVAAVRSGEPATRDVVVALPDGRRVHGTVGDVFDTSIVTATYSTLRPKQRITMWVQLVALGATRSQADQTWAGPDEPPVTAGLVVGRRGGRSAREARSLFSMPDDPVGVLFDLVRLRDGGLCAPLPMPLDCGAEFAERYTAPNRLAAAKSAARRQYESRYGSSTDRAIRLIYGGEPTASVAFDALVAECTPDPAVYAGVSLPPLSGEPLFCAVSHVVWAPLLACETST